MYYENCVKYADEPLKGFATSLSVTCGAHTSRVLRHSITPFSAVTYPYIAHCVGACSAKGDWSLFVSFSSSSRLSSPCSPKYIERDFS